MIPSFIDKSKIPHKPGVYIYKDDTGKIIYVGKALDLYHRVASYFNTKHLDKGDLKTAALVANIADIETIIVESELEALILEANLIKKHLPQYNIKLTDDKDYLYIVVTKEDFPRIITGRKKDLESALKYFGPFPSATTVKSTLKSLRRVFPWCSNPNGKRPCFYYHINLCPGPCAGEISREEYRKITNRFIKFMEGQKQELIDELAVEMNEAAQKQQFEEAATLKRVIEGIGYLTQPNRTHRYLENPNFLEDQRTKALEALKDALHLSKVPERIEGYDISNIQGHEATGSMVVLTNGEIDKSQYRKFKIHISGKPNDFAMHQEMMKRRLKHQEWPLPDIILIDGGKGQVSAVMEVLEEKIPMFLPQAKRQGSTSEQYNAEGILQAKQVLIFGIAKRMEWLYTPDGKEIKLPKSHTGLQLLIKLRDEAHRFAITFHRKLHRESVLAGGK